MTAEFPTFTSFRFPDINYDFEPRSSSNKSSEKDDCCSARTQHIVLPIIASLVGFVFLPVKLAAVITFAVTVIGCVLYCDDDVDGSDEGPAGPKEDVKIERETELFRSLFPPSSERAMSGESKRFEASNSREEVQSLDGEIDLDAEDALANFFNIFASGRKQPEDKPVTPSAVSVSSEDPPESPRSASVNTKSSLEGLPVVDDDLPPLEDDNGVVVDAEEGNGSGELPLAQLSLQQASLTSQKAESSDKPKVTGNTSVPGGSAGSFSENTSVPGGSAGSFSDLNLGLY